MIEQDKLANIKREVSVQCTCSKRVPIYCFVNKDYGICTWCGNRVYINKETEKKYKFKEQMRRAIRDSATSKEEK